MTRPHLPVYIQTMESPLGQMALGCTEKGICCLTWPDEDGMAGVERDIRKRHGVAPILKSHPYMAKLEQELDAYFAGERVRFEAPLDARGTPFEMRVWRQLIEIGYGRTKSYGQVAAAMGDPKASRAVGGANGANPVVIVVPCHRVVAANGSLHGFGGGIWRKKWLLELESGMRPDAF